MSIDKSRHILRIHTKYYTHNIEKRKIAKQEILIVIDELDTISFQSRHDTVSTIYLLDN